MAITNLGKHKKVLERGGRVGVVNHLFKTEKLYNIRIFVLIAIGKIMTLLCCHYLFVLFVHRCKSSIKIMNEILISTRMSTPVPTTYAYTHIVIFILLASRKMLKKVAYRNGLRNKSENERQRKKRNKILWAKMKTIVILGA